MLLRLAHLGVTNAVAMLRLLPMSDRAEDAEILALRNQIVVLQRQLRGQKIRFTQADRALLAALLHRLPRAVLRQIRLLVRPETVLRWHRDLIAARHARISRPKRSGRPPTVRCIRRARTRRRDRPADPAAVGPGRTWCDRALMAGASVTNLLVGLPPWVPLGFLVVAAVIAPARWSRTVALSGTLRRSPRRAAGTADRTSTDRPM